MPRKPRMFVANIPCHVIQRGNNRNVCFYSKHDYQFYLKCLNESCERYKVSLHAYVLMTNHVHLLLSPSDKTGVSKVMQSIGRRYVQYINKKLDRSGTLFEGRYKASLIEAESYFIACMRYIELNPVRANMVSLPKDYLWSSHHSNIGSKPRKGLTAHPVFQSLGDNPDKAFITYASLFRSEQEDYVVQKLRDYAHVSMPLGSEDFKHEIETALDRKIGYLKIGRPRKNKVRG